MADTTTKPRKVRHIPRRSGVGMRQVYGPHPWRERLLKARQGTPSEFAKARYIPFLKGYGVASANAYNQRYVCPCGSGIVAPLDDPEFMTDVMDHEAQHAEVEA